MSIKTSGLQYKRFYHDDAFWPEGAWIDYAHIKVNDGDFHSDQTEYDVNVDTIPDDAEVEIIYGCVYLDEKGKTEVDLVAYFRRWLKEQTRVIIRIEVDKEDAEGIKEVLRRVKNLEIL